MTELVRALGSILVDRCAKKISAVCMYPDAPGPVLAFKDASGRQLNVCKKCADHLFGELKEGVCWVPYEFYVIVVDHDTKDFTIKGPLTDDLELTKQVSEAQESGREVNCSTVDASKTSPIELKQEWSEQGYRHVEGPLL